MALRLTPVLRRAARALEDVDLIKALRSEINHELSSPSSFQDNSAGSPGDFAVDWDSAESQDVVLRRKLGSGEEVAVSALLGEILPETPSRPTYPREILMKVCLTKPGLSSVLQFDCRAQENSPFLISSAHFLRSTEHQSPSSYRGPLFSTLDPDLQNALEEYLAERGVDQLLVNYLLHHLHTKEQGQYVSWLQKLEAMVGQTADAAEE
ncbi:unnamed protein product [Linum tenue]|uniref:Mitochondrial glycoprotein n=1 Tax=Linum tenue TaxID=586396 RepID=A0AAV0GS64_9ROSI|nr:unnamed protein product [Linum tenue]